jgi:neopullulanase
MEITPPPNWVKDAIFYQIFPDRFALSGRRDNNSVLEPWGSPPTPHGFKGGDLWGIIERLEYLQDLGVTAIYLNPVFQSSANHRYTAHDYYQVDPLLGGNQALRQLLDEAHRRGVRVVLDGVFKHCGRGFHHGKPTQNSLPIPQGGAVNLGLLNQGISYAQTVPGSWLYPPGRL